MSWNYRVLMGLSLAFSVSCSTDDGGSSRVEVRTNNELGIVMLQVDRYEDRGASIVEVHGLDQSGGEVASVRRRTGDIADLPQQISGASTMGTEVVLTAANQRERVLSRGVDEIAIAPQDETISTFVEVAEVSATLGEAAKLKVPAAAPAPTEVGYQTGTMTCPADRLNVTPLAVECCSTYSQFSGGPQTVKDTVFINPSGQLVQRQTSGYGACKTSTGGSCSGDTCYYGPNGFAVATVTTSTTSYGWSVLTYYLRFNTECRATQNSNWQTEFPNVTGTFPRGLGCCLNGSGPCDGPYPACTSCGGGGSAGNDPGGNGHWDY
jgi:hypothetical protein